MTFQEEKLKDCLDEAKPLLYAHWEEIAHYKDIALDPDYEQYEKIDAAGMLRVYTAREEGRLVGYATYFIKNNIHYKTSICAMQDVLYMSPEYRLRGGIFIKWCDIELSKIGVNIIIQHVKAAHNFGNLLQRFGYELQDLIYTKRV